MDKQTVPVEEIAKAVSVAVTSVLSKISAPSTSRDPSHSVNERGPPFLKRRTGKGKYVNPVLFIGLKVEQVCVLLGAPTCPYAVHSLASFPGRFPVKRNDVGVTHAHHPHEHRIFEPGG